MGESESMEILIISGLSGSGKSKAASFLEDMGFYVDRQYWDGGQYYYRVFTPKSWL